MLTVFLRKFVNYANEDLVLSPTDSLFSDNDSMQLYYFEVFTKWLNGTDGYVSEGAGEAALRYLKQKPGQFVSFIQKDIESNSEVGYLNWQERIKGELGISYEDEEIKYMHLFRNKILDKCNTKEESEFIQLFFYEMIVSEPIKE
jgi:hypothetical protein